MPVHFYAFLIFVTVFFAGCGQKYTGPETQIVEGIVTLDGTPIEGAALRFIPKEPGVGEESIGRTDSHGKYTLTSVQGLPGKGAMIGDYTVTAQWMEKYPLDKPYKNPDSGDMITHGYRQSMPKIYHEVTTSPLTATITKGKNTIDFSLKSK